MKTIKFDPTLVPLILSGEKTTTWRLWDDKSLTENETVELVEKGTGRVFGHGVLTKVIEKELGQLSEEDKKGHEAFSNDEEMYETYKKYYQREVGPKTVVKIITFDFSPLRQE